MADNEKKPTPGGIKAQAQRNKSKGKGAKGAASNPVGAGIDKVADKVPGQTKADGKRTMRGSGVSAIKGAASGATGSSKAGKAVGGGIQGAVAGAAANLLSKDNRKNLAKVAIMTSPLALILMAGLLAMVVFVASVGMTPQKDSSGQAGDAADAAMNSGVSEDEYGPLVDAARRNGIPWEILASVWENQQCPTEGMASTPAMPTGGGDSAPEGKMDLVALGKKLVGMGWLASEHPAFGGVRAGHMPGSDHYNGLAIDLNWPGEAGNNSPGEMKNAPQALEVIKAAGWGAIWQNDAAHKNHIHIMPSGRDKDVLQGDPADWQKPGNSGGETGQTSVGCETGTAPESEPGVGEDNTPYDGPKGAFRYPFVGKFRVTSDYGMRTNPGDERKGTYELHSGIDLAGGGGQIVAATTGKVKKLLNIPTGGGNIVVQDIGDNTELWYQHLSKVDVKAGDELWPGKPIGTEGATGNVTGIHLHFTVMVDGKPVEPRAWMKKRGVDFPAVGSSVTGAKEVTKKPADSGEAPETSDKGKDTDDTTATPVSTGDLSLEEQVGQMFMVGVQAGQGTDTVTSLIKDQKVGNVLYLGGWSDPAKVKSTSESLQQAAGDSLLIAADQEGGKVWQIGTDPIPSALDQSKESSAALKKYGEKIGTVLKSSGVNMNLAPVADTVPTSMGTKNGPIGQHERQYGSDPTKVAAAVNDVMSGIHAQDVGTTVKHFPGIGRIAENTDFSTTGIDDPKMTKDDPYLEPFKKAASATDMMMMSSATYSKIDKGTPALFSKTIVSDMLRKDLGYDGVVITDDVSAEALSSIPAGERATRFISAGGDIVLVGDPSEAKSMVEAVVKKAKSDKGFAKKVKAAADRVAAAKSERGVNPAGSPTSEVDGPTDSTDDTPGKYITPWQIPTDGMSKAKQEELKNSPAKAADWVARKIYDTAHNSENRDHLNMNTGATYDPEDRSKRFVDLTQKDPKRVADAWVRAIIAPKLRGLTQDAEARPVYEKALSWSLGNKSSDQNASADGSMICAPKGGASLTVESSESGERVPLTSKQLGYAAAIAQAGKKSGITESGQVIALMVAFQESRMRVLYNRKIPESQSIPNDGAGADGKSVGLFQQQVGYGWGELPELMDPYKSALSFYGKLPGQTAPGLTQKAPDYDKGNKGEVAQRVQVSAHPTLYTQWEKAASTVLGKVKGISCTGGSSGDGKDKDGGKADDYKGYDIPAGGCTACVKKALSVVGTDYVYGGGNQDGPTDGGFDCSGLTQFAMFQGAGVTLPRTAALQRKAAAKAGTLHYDKSKLKPGDLVFSRATSDGGAKHVSMYIGNGKVVEAPKPGVKVRVIPLSQQMKYSTPFGGFSTAPGYGGSK